MARPKSEDKKQALLEAATAAFAQSGIAASTSAIARSAGVAEGGDKDIPYMGLTKEANPFLGYRAIRFCLDRLDSPSAAQLIFHPMSRIAVLRFSTVQQ